MKRILPLTVAAALWALVGAGSASAHFIVVDPPGNGDGTSHHVGQAAAAGHNSCQGHLVASTHEQSGAVTFLGPSVCPP